MIPCAWNMSPFTELSVSIRSFTVYGSSRISEISLRSPPALPEAPTFPRSFVSFVREEINEEFVS